MLISPQWLFINFHYSLPVWMKIQTVACENKLHRIKKHLLKSDKKRNILIFWRELAKLKMGIGQEYKMNSSGMVHFDPYLVDKGKRGLRVGRFFLKRTWLKKSSRNVCNHKTRQNRTPNPTYTHFIFATKKLAC